MTEDLLTKKKKGKKSPRVVMDDERKSPLHVASESVIETERGELSAARRRREAREGAAMTEPDCGKRDFSAEERRRLAREHKALPDGSYPIESELDLESAAHLARTGHGDVE